MRFPKFFRNKKKASFSSVAVLHRHSAIRSFTPILRKRSIMQKHMQTVQHTHLNQIQTTVIQLHADVVQKQSFPIYLQQQKQRNLLKLYHLPIQKKKQFTRLLSMRDLQHMSDLLLKTSLKKEQDYYKYHPALARTLAVSLFYHPAVQKQLPANKKVHQGSAAPLVYALQANQIQKQLVELFQLQKEKETQHLISKPQPQKETKQEIQLIRIEEYHRLVEEVYRKIERCQKKERQRRGRS